jgi:hypothetical protein
VTWLAEMRGAETEPKSYRTAVSTFKLNGICSVLWTIIYTNTSFLCNASSANKVFLFKSRCILYFPTISQTTKIRIIAGKACVKGKLLKSIFLEIIIEGITRILQSIVLINSFDSSPF